MEIGPPNQCLMSSKPVKSLYLSVDENWFGIWFSNPLINENLSCSLREQVAHFFCNRTSQQG